MKTALLIAFFSMCAAGALIISGVSLMMRFHQTNTLRADQTHAWVAVICDIEHQVVSSKLPLTQKLKDVKFYDGLLINDIHTAACGIPIGGIK